MTRTKIRMSQHCCRLRNFDLKFESLRWIGVVMLYVCACVVPGRASREHAIAGAKYSYKLLSIVGLFVLYEILLQMFICG